VKLPAYPKYKASGVDWLGDVPDHWEVKRLKMAVRLSDHKVEADEENPVPYIGMENIESWTGRLLPINPDVVPTGTANEFAAGDTLFGKLRPYLAKACNPDFAGLCSTELLVLKGAALDRRALIYSLLSDGFIKLVDSSTYGSKMPRASWDFVGNCLLPIAPHDEQLAIADFLDRETAKIDALVAKKRMLIERLKEKRTALISRTVTRGLPPAAARAAGLDPNPKLKSSGIDWLGDIPNHWNIRRVATDSTKITNGFVGPTRDILVDDGVPYLQSLHIKGNRVLFARPYFVEQQWSAEHSKSILSVDDVVIVQTGDIGQVAVVPKEFAGANCHALIIVSPRWGRLSGAFLSQFLNSSFGFDELKRIETGALHPHLNCGLVRDVCFPSPPLQEQLAIVEFLGRETAKIDSMVIKIEAAAERLQEYRTALITAAVTGKVDVRGATL